MGKKRTLPRRNQAILKAVKLYIVVATSQLSQEDLEIFMGTPLWE